MIRGNISNKPSDIVMVDWKVLIEPKISLSKLSSEIFHNYLLFSDAPKKYFALKKNAKGWLERNYKYRIGAYTIALEEPFKLVVEPMLFSLVAELEHFEDKNEFREWLRINTQVLCAITIDKELVGASGGAIKEFLGWGPLSEYR